MLVKTIVNNENRRKLEIIKNSDDLYSVKYYEYYKTIGWRLIGTDEGYTKDCIEWEYDIEVA